MQFGHEKLPGDVGPAGMTAQRWQVWHQQKPEPHLCWSEHSPDDTQHSCQLRLTAGTWGTPRSHSCASGGDTSQSRALCSLARHCVCRWHWQRGQSSCTTSARSQHGHVCGPGCTKGIQRSHPVPARGCMPEGHTRRGVSSQPTKPAGHTPSLKVTLAVKCHSLSSRHEVLAKGPLPRLLVTLWSRVRSPEAARPRRHLRP